LKPEWWGSPLVQEKYQAEKACDKRHPYNNNNNNNSKSLRKFLSNIPGKHEIKEIQKTAHTRWKILMLKYNTYFTGEITLRVAQIVNIEQLQQYIP
jgi:hypothetical protein